MNWHRPGFRGGLVLALVVAWMLITCATRNEPTEDETAKAIADDLRDAKVTECKRNHGRAWCEKNVQ